MSKAQEIFDDWHYHASSRSPEYQKGCLYILRMRLDGSPKQQCPYPIATAQADAWFAGSDCGHALIKLEQQAGKL